MSKYTFRLTNIHRSFYDPETNLHLHYYQPVGSVDHITKAIDLAVKSKRIEEMTQVKTEKIVQEAPKQGEAQEPEKLFEEAEELQPEELKEDEIINLDFDAMSKEEMTAFIADNEVTYKELGVSSRSGEEKIRAALKEYFAQ